MSDLFAYNYWHKNNMLSLVSTDWRILEYEFEELSVVQCLFAKQYRKNASKHVLLNPA